MALRATVMANAEQHVADLAEVEESIRAGGTTSLRTMAAALKVRAMLTWLEGSGMCPMCGI